MSAEQAWEDMRAYNIRLEERARKAERALAEIARLSPFVSPEDDNSIRKAPAIARSALRPSEDTSDPFSGEPGTSSSAGGSWGNSAGDTSDES